jgi:hypothetical protein
MKNRWCITAPLGVTAQALALKRFYPETAVVCRKGLLTWTGVASPRGTSLLYSMRLTYRPGDRPEIRIIEPDLKIIAEGRTVPHLFSQREQTLCLHFRGIWKSDMLLAMTIIPWAVLWTEYFEGWLFTNEWAGDEIEHSGVK